MSHEWLYDQHSEAIGKAIQSVCRRERLSGDEAEELRSLVNLKLVEDDFAALRKFEGRSKIKTYLVAVVANVLFDERRRQWGKWRPSAESKRLGPIGVALDQLIRRDGLTKDEAFLRLIYKFGCEQVVELSEQLDALSLKLSQAPSRRPVGLDDVPEPAAVNSPDAGLVDRDWRHVCECAAKVLSDLPAQDRLIIRMHYTDGKTLAEIARILQLEQHRLYRRLESILRNCREALEKMGVDPPAFDEFFR